MLLGACGHAAPPAAASSTHETPAGARGSVPEARAYAWYLKGRAAEGLGDEEMAVRGMSWADRLDRSDPALHQLLASHAFRKGDDEEALRLCLDAIDAAPEVPPCERPWAYQGAARAWLRLGHPGDARALLDRLSACPHPELEARWAWAVGDRGRAQEALGRARPRLPADRLSLARLAVALERHDLALTWLAPVVGHPAWPEAAPLLAEVAPHHPAAVRALLGAVAPEVGAPWATLLADLQGAT